MREPAREPTSGQIFVEGIEITDPDVDVDKVRSRIGMVFQQFNLFPHLSVLSNLTIAQQRVRKGGSKDEAVAVARRNLEQVGLRRRSTPTRPTCPAASSSAWRSRGRCRWTPT